MNEYQDESAKPKIAQRVFALVTDGEVFHKWYIDEDYSIPDLAALIYGLQSSPTIVDITDKNYEEIDFGWTMDGNSFFPPENSRDA
jgi:hypothetical protein